MRERQGPFKRLVSLTCTCTVECRDHGSHTATMSGPYLKVLDAVYLLRQACLEADRWLITEYTPSEDELPLMVSEWTP